jgi:hypothetical protein
MRFKAGRRDVQAPFFAINFCTSLVSTSIREFKQYRLMIGCSGFLVYLHANDAAR